MPIIKTTRPNCIVCGNKMVKGVSVGGKNPYFCINKECSNKFKTVDSGDDGTSTASADSA